MMYSTIPQSTIITSQSGFNIALTNVNARLKQCCINIVPVLFRRWVKLSWRCFNVEHWRCINVLQRWKSDVGFCFIFNVGSTLFQRWSTTLKQRWSNVEMLAGLFPRSSQLDWRGTNTSFKSGEEVSCVTYISMYQSCYVSMVYYYRSIFSK